MENNKNNENKNKTHTNATQENQEIKTVVNTHLQNSDAQKTVDVDFATEKNDSPPETVVSIAESSDAQKTVDVDFATEKNDSPPETVVSIAEIPKPNTDIDVSPPTKTSQSATPEVSAKKNAADKKTAQDLPKESNMEQEDSWKQKVKSIGATLGKSTSGKDITIENLKGIPNEERYEIRKTLGKGGMGVVLLARDNILQREVAMKLIKGNNITDTSRYRFMREARISGVLEHPNIITIYDISCLDDLYFTMRMVGGVTLAHIIEELRNKTEQSKEYTIVRRLEIMKNICYALEFAHSKKIIHRDLKPENIMIGEFGEVLVLDWGLAKKIGEEEQNDTQQDKEFTLDFADETAQGSIIGTPRYMSPEQAQGETKTIDESTDIYSLGAILYELLALQPTFSAKNVLQLIDLVVTAPVEKKRFNSNGEVIPKELMAIALKAMAKQKLHRYHSVRELRDDLRLFAEGKSVHALRDNWFAKLEKMIARNAAMAVVGFAFIVFIAWGYHFLTIHKASASAGEQALKIQKKYWVDEVTKQVELSQKRWQSLVAQRSQILDVLRREQNKSSATKLLTKATELNARIEECEQRIESLCKNVLNFSSNQKIQNILAQTYLDSAKRAFRERNYTDFSHIREKVDNAIKLNPQLEAAAQNIQNYGTIFIANSIDESVTLHRIVNKEGLFLLQNIPQFVQNKSWELELGSYALKTSQCFFPFNVETQSELQLPIFRLQNPPNNMAFVPGGKFYVGARLFVDDYQQQVEVKPFFIDETEVTFGHYKKFFQALGTDKHIPRVMLANSWENLWDDDLQLRFGLEDNTAVFGINYYAAKDYCKWRSRVSGVRFDLPRVKEWEKAARGTDGRTFPWGEKQDPSLANVAVNQQFGRVAKVKSFTYDCSIYGIYDMAGNVSEWTSTPTENGKYFVKGSHFNAVLDRARTYVSYAVEPEHAGFIGFRCVCRTVKIKKQ